LTLAGALSAAAARGIERLDAQLLLLHALGRSRSDRAWLLAHDGEALPEEAQAAYRELCERRAGTEPLAYIVGRKEFFGLELHVDSRVLVPRPDTETLVEWALEVMDDRARVIDLGTGSGAIALAIKQARPQAAVDAVDSSPGALEVGGGGRGNTSLPADPPPTLSLDVNFVQGSWLAGNDQRYDLIVANPPYVAQADPHLRDLGHEPIGALAAGPDGLREIRIIIGEAPAHLRPRGWLMLEHGWDQAEAVRGLLRAAGLGGVATRPDLAGIERCSGGQRLEL
jgi:release factor glutamine methyltransferase